MKVYHYDIFDFLDYVFLFHKKEIDDYLVATITSAVYDVCTSPTS